MPIGDGAAGVLVQGEAEGKIGAKTVCALEACLALDRHGEFIKSDNGVQLQIWYFLPKRRLEGGIEPLRVSPPTGLKPAHRTTEDHLGGGDPWSTIYKAVMPLELQIFSCYGFLFP